MDWQKRIPSGLGGPGGSVRHFVSCSCRCCSCSAQASRPRTSRGLAVFALSVLHLLACAMPLTDFNAEEIRAQIAILEPDFVFLMEELDISPVESRP